MTRSTHYPPADAKVQPRAGGVAMSSIEKVVLHSTETDAFPGYPSNWPTLTYHTQLHKWRQHMLLNLSATALVDPSSTSVRENRDGVVQVELVGYCDPKQIAKGRLDVQQLDAQAISDLGAFLSWLNAEWGLPLVTLPKWVAYPASYGNGQGQRLSGAQYDAFRGVLGHQHVSGNDHGDPGLIPIDKILNAAKGAAAPAAPAPVAPAGSTPTKPILEPVTLALVEGGRVYTGWKATGTNPATGKSWWAAGFHPGEDWHCNLSGKEAGRKMGAAVSGRVVHVGVGGWGAAFGLQVIVEDSTGDRTLHGHFRKTLVSVGDWVSYGDPVGELGATGNVSGVHCHVERRHSPYGYYDHEQPLYGIAAGFPGTAAFKLGQSHPAVTLLGRRLIAHGYAGTFTSGSYKPGPNFSEIDRANVRAFQLAQGWTGSDADGFPGPSTWARLQQRVIAVDDPAPTTPAPVPKPPTPKPPTTPKPPADVKTSLRALTLNCRLPSLSDDDPKDRDEEIRVRLPRIVKLIRGFAPSIAVLQECDASLTLKPLLSGLGPSWKASGIGKVWVSWDSSKWAQVGKTALTMLDNAGEADRRCVIVRLKSVKTGGTIVVVGTHLGVHFEGEAAWRIKQATAILAAIRAAGVGESDAVLLGGDFNDSKLVTAAGVRQTFAKGAPKLIDLRARLDDASMHGDGYDTHHGYGARRERGVWLDDLLTGGTLRPVEGWVLRTDASASADVRFATDHNAVAARLTFTTKG